MSTHGYLYTTLGDEEASSDGSEQIMEKTQYKLLINGYTLAESTAIQLNDIKDIMGNTLDASLIL